MKTILILSLDILRLEPGLYEAYCTGEVGGSTHHASLTEALAYYGNTIPPEFARFVEPRYGGVSLGTMQVCDLATQPAALADRLTELVAQVNN